MRIEKDKIQLAPLNLGQIRMNGGLVGFKQSKHIPLSTQQIEILVLMKQGLSIEEIVQSFLNHRILISFLALNHLIQLLLQEGLILNSKFHNYFSETGSQKKESFFGKIVAAFKREEEPSIPVQEELRKIPFLRSLAPELLSVFLKNMKVIRTPAGVTVCKEGDTQRSLFVLLKGNASVYKKSANQKRIRVAGLTEGAVFGEVGFLLGEPRTADIVTDESCEIVKLKYKPEIFDDLIEKEKARHLQKRFWTIHSLLKSETFKAIPDDCFDSLVFAGEVRQFPAGHVVCQQGELGESCYIVVQGSLVVSIDGESIRVLKQGDSFGEIALLNNQGKRSASVQTQTEVWALEIHYQKFYQLLSQNLILACEFERLASQRLNSDQHRKD